MVRALSGFESLSVLIDIKKEQIPSVSTPLWCTFRDTVASPLVCLTTQACGFGTRLRTTHLKTVSQTVFLTARALSGFESLRCLLV